MPEESNDLVALRVAADFAGPVPVSDVTVETRIVRAACRRHDWALVRGDGLLWGSGDPIG